MTVAGCQKSTVLLKPTIPANLIQPCLTLNQIEAGTGKDVLLWVVDTVAKYNECAAKVDALIEIGKALR
ncbi:Rz1-like lysis system protein LysC [Acinetobacter higginsii]|uniref:Rz1-like lysis system protein LysC n=1 Tax=Acinetobacter higginsii TaxID=70347 RepID=UPI003D17B80F